MGIVFLGGSLPHIRRRRGKKARWCTIYQKTFLHQSKINWLWDIAKNEYCNFIFVFGEFLSSLSFFGREAIRGIKSGEKMKKHGLVLMGKKEEKVSITHMHLPYKNENQIYYFLQKRSFQAGRENEGPKIGMQPFRKFSSPPPADKFKPWSLFFLFSPPNLLPFLRKESRSMS